MPDHPVKPLLRAAIAGNGVLCLTLDSPENRNALSLAMIEAFERALGKIAGDSSVRCVVIGGEGGSFCAGHDLRELTAARQNGDGGRAFYEETMLRCAGVMQAIAALPQPVIAAVEGVATAAGCQLVATCDLAIAGEAARFCTPGVDIGLFCSTPAVALGRNVGRKQAMEMLLTGEMIDAVEARRIGLVNRVVVDGEAWRAARALATQIAAKPTNTVRQGKRIFRAQISEDVASAYAIAGAAMVEGLLDEDAREGIGAFLEKRRPQWR